MVLCTVVTKFLPVDAEELLEMLSGLIDNAPPPMFPE
jgi:hypothetical protein